MSASDNTGARVHASTPWLTVIMPVYQGEQWIEETLGSIAREAEEGIEVLIIDSSPNAASIEIAQRFAGPLDLHIHPNSPLQSWQAKTNRGAELAGAAHLCWLHQDDIWLPGRARSVRAWIEQAPDAALHIAPSTIIDQASRRLGLWRCPFRDEGQVDSNLFVERLLVQNFIAAPAPVYRKDAWIACGGLDEDLWYTGDWDVWLKLAAQGSVFHHRDVTCAFRVHNSSLTVTGSRNAGEFERQMLVVLERHLPRLSARAKQVRDASLASIGVNGALAAAAGGDWRGLLPAAARVFALGPKGIHRYMRDSRIVDRLLPRLRAKLTGSF